MFILTADNMQAMAKNRRDEQESEWVKNELRQGYELALQNVDDSLLRQEIRACLDRCDALGLEKPADRMSFCAMDIVGFPGFRALPQLPALVTRYADAPQGVMLSLLAEAPPEFWTRLLERSEAVRRERGMP